MDQKIFSTICYALFKDTSKQCFLPELLSLLYIEFNCYTQAIVFHCLCVSVSLEVSSIPTSHLSASSPRKAKSLELVRQ